MTPLSPEFERTFAALETDLLAADRSELPAIIARHVGIAVTLWMGASAAISTATVAEPPFISIAGASEILGLPERRVRSLARSAPWAKRIGRTIRIDRAALIEAVKAGTLARHVRHVRPQVHGTHASRR